MLVSWNWLKDYVTLDMPAEELARRLMMAGLNHENTEQVGDDLAIDLEVTSNRPDCLGHLGIAREIAVLYGREVNRPAAAVQAGGTAVQELTKVTLDCPDLCSRYTAHVIQGVKVGPSPDWLAGRLATIGIAAINNVVDITNYVLMECGQPLHAFDLAKLRGRRIVVRDARPGENFLAINHKTYDLTPGICVIADAEHAVGLGGVMGGADSEVSAATSDVLVESAEFSPIAIRDAARRLGLRSDSSYRFERGVDPEGVDWASRRCCELLLDLAGGSLAAGVIDVGQPSTPRQPIVLRLSQLKRILGIEIASEEVRRILTALGNEERRHDDRQIEVIPPSWRRDLSREIDLVEEVARIHGYEAIPEDVSVPMAPSARTDEDRMLTKVRHALTAAGYDEALTLSVVEQDWSQAFSPWTGAEPLRCQMPILRGADHLRRSLIPSLLGARRTNETLANPIIELFEIARIYLPRAGSLPSEELMLGLTSGGDYYSVKGVLEAVVEQLSPAVSIEVRDTRDELFAAGRCGQLLLDGETWGYLGEVSPAGMKRFDLRGPTTVAEVKLSVLGRVARLVPKYAELSPYPAISQDLNFVVEESVRWATLAAAVRQAAGGLLEDLEYRELYRSEQLGPGKKSLLLTVTFRDRHATLTGEQADQLRQTIVTACGEKLGARLR